MRIYALVALASLGLSLLGWAYWQGVKVNKVRVLESNVGTLERINESLSTPTNPDTVDDRLRDLAR